ncbi:MAG TPA: hypothetical protein VG474_06575 [Solirubrobacteraceae bacterium]|nr:hypothetical protein [Solirubrobacteraceae bacterium]
MGQRPGVSFELERLDLQGGELVVSGHWSGVGGLRFVRPTLVAEDRRILATLEHKPWAPSLDRTWVAAFPWDGGDVDADALALAVSPQVTVPLGDAPVAVVEPSPAPRPARPPSRTREPEPTNGARARRRAAEPVAPPPRLAEPGLRSERVDPAPPHLAEPEPAPLELRAVEPSPTLEELAGARAAAERDRDRALAQLAEAVAAREAAVRSHRRMELAHDEALRARERAEAELAAMQVQRDEANAQRDELVLAYGALRRHLQAERAQEDRARGDEPAGDGDADEPIGVRTMPAARTVIAELQRPRPTRTLPVSQIDLWVIRVLAIVAGACFLMLLVSILLVFI